MIYLISLVVVITPVFESIWNGVFAVVMLYVTLPA